MGMPLTIVDVPSEEARDLYQADLALIRPDQIVAWRGNSADDAVGVFEALQGADDIPCPLLTRSNIDGT